MNLTEAFERCQYLAQREAHRCPDCTYRRHGGGGLCPTHYAMSTHQHRGVMMAWYFVKEMERP